MDQVLERIAAWEADGLVDPATAARLRLAEEERSPDSSAPVEPPAARSSARRGPSSVASVFGPGVSIGEMFAYLGGAFLLGAYETFVVRLAGPAERPELAIAIGSALSAVALAVFGMILVSGDARRRRAAGVMFGLAVAHVGAVGAAVAAAVNLEWPLIGVVGALAATVAAVGLRILHGSLLTQVTLLASVTSLAGLSLSLLESLILPEPEFGLLGDTFVDRGPNPIVLVLISAAWWLATALVVGLIGLREAQTADDDAAAGRRASLTRLWAGLVAVTGLATSVMRTDYAIGYSGRIVEPWLGDLAILVLAAVLVERAFRRDSSTFVYAAALGLMVALSDFNFSYLSSSTELGLLLEGVILIGAGVGADRLRRRIGQPGPGVAVPATPA